MANGIENTKRTFSRYQATFVRLFKSFESKSGANSTDDKVLIDF